MIEKDYIIKNNSKLDDHALLKAYYEKSTSDYGINFDIIGLILKKILKSNNEGTVKLTKKHYVQKFIFKFKFIIKRFSSNIFTRSSRNHKLTRLFKKRRVSWRI